jgi:hypothetical protein
MPNWFGPLLALMALLGFLYFAFLRKKPVPRSGNDPHHGGSGGGPDSGD